MKSLYAILCLIFLTQFIASCRTSFDYANTCPYDLNKIVKEAELGDFQALQPVFWRQQRDKRPWISDEVVLLGKKGNKYLLFIVFRHPEPSLGTHRNWTKSGIRLFFDSGGDELTYKAKEYSSFPTQKDVDEFLAMWWKKEKYFETVFEGKTEIKKPTNACF